MYLAEQQDGVERQGTGLGKLCGQCYGISTFKFGVRKYSSSIIIFILKKTFDGNAKESSVKRK